MEATTKESRYEQLIRLCSGRGFSRLSAVLLVTVGLIPAVLLTLTRSPTNDDTLLIAGLFVLVPTVLLVRAAMRDRDAQGARELVMWLRVVSKAEPWQVPQGLDRDFNQLTTDNPQFAEVALEVRDQLAPLVGAPTTLAIRIAIYRYWYAIIWIVISLILVGVYLVVFPTPA
jgi:hypothetical protein